MRTLVIPDIHTRFEIAQQIIDLEAANRIVLLGDYFDDWTDSADSNAATAEWLKDKLEDPNIIALWGNHDQHYLLDNWIPWACSGFTRSKRTAIRSILKSDDTHTLRLAANVDGWLLSHAGFHPRLLRRMNGEDPVAVANGQVLEEMLAGKVPELVAIGRDRGGPAYTGGITWLDWHSFRSTPGVRQICGHTENALPRNEGENWCIDTRLGHYAIIEDGTLEIKECKGLQ